MMALSEQERRFVDAYTGPAAGNGTEAARLAGYQGAANVLAVQSTRLLKKANVQAAIEARRQRLTEKADITAAKALQRLSEDAEMMVDLAQVDDATKLRVRAEARKHLAKHLMPKEQPQERPRVSAGFLQRIVQQIQITQGVATTVHVTTAADAQVMASPTPDAMCIESEAL